MGTIHIVVGDELTRDRAQVLFVQDNQVIRALAPQGSDHPLGHSIRARGSERRQQGLGPERSDSSGKLRSVRAVAIPE